jgi:hypothetical protein
MFNQIQFRQFAGECIASARSARSDCERQQFLDMAKIWMTAARQLDDGMGRESPVAAPARILHGWAYKLVSK